MTSMKKRRRTSGREGLPGKPMEVKSKGNEKHHGRPKLEKVEEYSRKGSNVSPNFKGSKILRI